MAPIQPYSVDTFILTFNAAKNPINVPVFANHLYNAFRNNATSLPELVVISLQEMAPLAKALVGSYVLQPYFQRYESAVNLAAAKFLAEAEGKPAPPPREDRTTTTTTTTYRLATTRNVGMTDIMLFARNWTALHDIQTTELGFGAGDMANKGAVGLRFLYTKEEDKDEDEDEDEEAADRGRTTEFTFVTTHLQAMEWNLETRNKNWETIVSRLLFDDPNKFISAGSLQETVRGSDDNEEEAQNLLDQDEAQKALHDISIYKPGSHLFVSGDLNYRLSKTSPESGAIFPSLDPASPDHYARFFPLDQLTAEKKAGRTLHGLSEAEIKFPPTYKLKITPQKKKAETEAEREQNQEDDVEEEEVQWKWATHRWPGWCDRVLYLDIPWWATASSSSSSPSSSSTAPPQMKVIAYDALPAVRTSDHRAVYLRVGVPALEPAELAPTPPAIEAELARVSNSSSSNSGDGALADPRVKLPFPIDTKSWDNRASVKQWERALGWSMLAAQSRPAIALLATVLVVGLGAWWYHGSGFPFS